MVATVQRPSALQREVATLRDGLARLQELRGHHGRGVLSLLEWTEQYRSIEGAPLRPSELPWLRDLYQLGPEVAEAWVMKASQVFVSEWMVSTALWVCDTGLGGRGNALYLFPTQSQGDDFAQARIDKAIEDSDHLSSRLGVVGGLGRSAVARVRLKRIGRGHFYLRGSDKRRQLLTIDADALFPDEVEEFREGTLNVARKRLTSARQPMIRGGSTPKYPATGIAAIFQPSTRRRYFLKCERCRHRQSLRFPDNLTEDGRLVCARCQKPLRPDAEGEWVAEERGASVEGYQVNRLYSPRADLKEMARIGYGIKANLITDPTAIQEFHNQDLGEPHAPAGGSLTNDVLRACMADYAHEAPVSGKPVVMGVDVGGVLNVWIKGPAPKGGSETSATPPAGATRLLYAGTVPNDAGWDELARLMHRYDVDVCVIDAEPEGQKAARFVQRFPGRVWRCHYPNMRLWQLHGSARLDRANAHVSAHRTRTMDATFDRFYRRLEQLPREAPHLPGLFAQLKAPIRVTSKDADGQTIARYDEGSAADHYAHSANYAEIARLIALANVPASSDLVIALSGSETPEEREALQRAEAKAANDRMNAYMEQRMREPAELRQLNQTGIRSGWEVAEGVSDVWR